MAMIRTPSTRLGFRVADSVLERDVVSRTLDERDYNLLLNPSGGPFLVYMPDGKPLACYLPGALSGVMDEVGAYSILHPLHVYMTNNRGMASGTKRIERGAGDGTRSDAMPVASAILGTFEPSGVYRYCRATEWTGDHLPEWETLAPLFRVIARHFEERVTERYNVQMDMVRKTEEGWVVPGTPFSTITVNNCVDQDTECLTRRAGWTRYDELTRDDEILAYDPETDTTCWEQLRDLFINPEYRGEMIKLSTRSFTALTTPDHRWPLRGRSTHPTWKVFTSENIPTSYWSFVRAAEHEAPPEATYEDAFVRLAAWYFTEGTLLRAGTSISLCQSDTHNPHHVDEIRRTIKELGAISLEDWRYRTCSFGGCNESVTARELCQRHYNQYRYQLRKSGEVTELYVKAGKSRRSRLVVNEYADEDKITWVLTGTPVADLISVVQGKDKVPSMDFLCSLTPRQADIFVDTCIKGDGLAERNAFTQYNAERMDAFVTAAVLAGAAPSASSDGTYCALWNSRFVYCDEAVSRVAIPYEGVVWCPSVPSGHWVARRDGKVHITGNSYPTGVHKDKGDLVDGFSTIACIRRGEFEGGVLVFPQYRVGVDMQDGDLLLMDAHQWHGNTRMTCACGERIVNKFCSFCGAERISIVSYYRTKMAECGTPEAEFERAVDNTEKRSQPRATPVAEPITGPIPPEAEPQVVQLDEPAAAVILPDSERLPEPEPEAEAEADKPKRTRKPRGASIATVPPAAEAAATEAEAVKPKRAPRKRAAAKIEAVAIALDPETGEPLEG